MEQLAFLGPSLLFLAMTLTRVKGQSTFSRVKALESSFFSSSNASTTLRPLADQTDVMNVSVSFSLVAIMALDDVKQELVTNGFMALTWQNEINFWDPTAYGGVDEIHPEVKSVWRPRLIIINTFGARDLFEDDHTHMVVLESGHTVWLPGGLFQTYCALNLEKFPFDTQRCHIQTCPMSHTTKTLRFIPNRETNKAFFFPNPGWELVDSYTTVEDIYVVEFQLFSCPTIHFELKRRPDILIFSVLIPIVLLSFLNNLVFVIPIESGEKISYAVTVLLSLFVFLSMVTTLTPQKSDIVPVITIYLFVLLIASFITVGLAIGTVFLHHKDEKEQETLKTKSNLQGLVSKINKMRAVVKAAENNGDQDSIIPPPATYRTPEVEKDKPEEEPHESNSYRVISRHINKLFFVVMTTMWFIITIWFFAHAAS